MPKYAEEILAVVTELQQHPKAEHQTGKVVHQCQQRESLLHHGSPE